MPRALSDKPYNAAQLSAALSFMGFYPWEMNMTAYLDVLDRKFAAAETISIKGVPLELGAEHPLRARGYFPVLSPTCVCVTAPCPCDESDDLFVWLPESGVRSRQVTELKNKSGEALHEFQVMREADIVTETFTRRKAAGFNPRARNIGSHRMNLPALSSPPSPPIKPGSIQLFASVVCAGNTLYYVREGSDGQGGTLIEYIAIGSCETVMS
jgi:hypothetical protein